MANQNYWRCPTCWQSHDAAPPASGIFTGDGGPDPSGYFTSPETYYRYLESRERDGKPAYVSQAFLRAANASAIEFAEIDEAMGTPINDLATDEECQAWRLAFLKRHPESPQATGAVDPSVDIRESGPRAKESLSTAAAPAGRDEA